MAGTHLSPGWHWVVLVLGVVLTLTESAVRVTPGFGLEEVISGEFSARGFQGRWITGNTLLYTDKLTSDVIMYDASSGNESILVDGAVLLEYRAASYDLSADGLFLLLSYDRQSGFRHSSSAKYVIYDLLAKMYSPVGDSQYLLLVKWAPVGHSLVYVLDNDIYYRPSASHGAPEWRVTFNSDPDVYYNGVPDWVYEEEVLGSGSALWFSPDGKRLAFASFDDSEVKTASYSYYGENGTPESQYSQTINIRYPKPGTKNPMVSLKVVNLLQDLKSGNHRVVNLPAPEEVVTSDHILVTVTWSKSEEVVAGWLNRVQNKGALIAYDASSGGHRNLYEMREPNGWIDLMNPLFDSTGARFLMVRPQQQGADEGAYNHLTLLTQRSMLRGVFTAETSLTAGKLVVTAIYGWDKKSGNIFYAATLEDSPSTRHVFVVRDDASEPPRCLSCDVKTLEGRPCLYATASFSLDTSHYALTCSGPDPIHVALYHTESQTQLALWEANHDLREKLKGRAMPQFLDMRVPVSGGFNARVRLWLPPTMDRSGRTKYPLIVYVYAGPNSAQISDAFTLGWGAYLTTNRSVIYAMIDGRGSGLKGNDILFSVYKRLGSVEIEDQISVASALQKQMPYIDTSRTGIWGWSYGGYATAMALATDTGNVFKCGVSVAPVTSWMYYDSIYTERYMGDPAGNLANYNSSDVSRHVENFREKNFYLIHGNADDNVHYLNSMILSRALERADVLFRQQSYPDENHNLGHVGPHLYHSMDHFWADCFQ